ENKPYTYDAITRQEIASQYVLNGNILSFGIDDSDNDIVIDPTIGWGTYYGFTSDETQGWAVAADATGAGYLAGSTTNASNIATFGAHAYTAISAQNQIKDAFIVKFNINGSREWATYYGGEDEDEILDATCDKNNNLYISGSTYSMT